MPIRAQMHYFGRWVNSQDAIGEVGIFAHDSNVVLESIMPQVSIAHAHTQIAAVHDSEPCLNCNVTCAGKFSSSMPSGNMLSVN